MSSELIPTEPCTPVNAFEPRQLPPVAASPLSPTPPTAYDDSADFTATFGTPAGPQVANTLTLRLAGAPDGDVVEVQNTPGTPPDDNDSPAGAVTTPTPRGRDGISDTEVLRALDFLRTHQGRAYSSAITATAVSTGVVQQATTISQPGTATLQASMLPPDGAVRKDATTMAAPAAATVSLRDNGTVATAGRAGAGAHVACVAAEAARAEVSSSGSGQAGGGPVAATASSRLADKMAIERIVAMGREFWLAHGDVFRNSTAWFRDGRAEILVYRAAAEAAREAQAAHAADPDAVAAPESPDRAKGWTIGSIPNDRCYLRSDGNYKGPNAAMPFLRPFPQTTLSCALGPPPAEFPELVGDYNASLVSLRNVLPRGVNERSGHVYQNASGQHLRLRHALFAAKPDDEEQGEQADDGTSLPAHFTMAGWPTYSPAAAQALAEIANTHVVRPLPAFDLKGDLIPPSRYLTDLRGATVLVGFSSTVYHITDKTPNGKDVVRTNVCLDIDHIRVLIAPPQFASKKRSAVHLTDPISHARQKRRALW